MRKFSLAAVPLVLVTAAAAWAANPLVGTWKENLAKSHLAAGTLAFAPARGGAIRFTQPGGTYTFKTDGSPATNPDGDTAKWTQVNSHAWQEVLQEGSVTRASRWTLSHSGSVLTLVSTETQPDGTPLQNTSVFRRVGPGKDLFGSWRDVQEKSNQPAVLRFSENSDGTMSWTLPALKATLRIKLDGTPSTPTGPTVPHGLTLGVTKTGPSSFHVVQKLKGKVIYSGTMTVSPEGNVLTERGRTPGESMTTDVYDKVN